MSRTPPPLPGHFNDSVQPVYNQNVKDNTYPIYPDTVDDAPLTSHHRTRDSFSDNRYNQFEVDEISAEKGMYRQKKKRSCMDKLCCGCCTCCPKWARWCSCIFLILIIILLVIIGIFAATFKVPEINFTGIDGGNIGSLSNGVINSTFNVGITVNNPNIMGLTFDNIEAKAYYPQPYNVYVGGGIIRDVQIKSKAITTIAFPFTLTLDMQNKEQQGALVEIARLCAEGKNIGLDYDVYPTVKIIGIPITPKVSQSLNMPCPISQEEIMSLLGPLTALS
ncbi:hypothetical protein BDB01DRAFT_796837 [Pilobolus umbonatus]|nr:hypothetical protein BDB01DRAFT_796837 [Pilobolus umbonatus]